MDRPIIRDGEVVFENGVILAVGDAKSLRAAHPDAERHDLGPAVILPGLVNAHTHLELSHHRPTEHPPAFVEWVQQLRERTTKEGQQRRRRRTHALRDGLRESIGFGVTGIGDITNCPELQRPLAAKAGAKVTSFREVRAMAQRRHLLPEMLDSAFAGSASLTGRVRAGVSPHAPYSAEPDAYRACLRAARTLDAPLQTHLAELPYEAEFLARHSGPLRDLWTGIGGWDDRVPTFQGGPIRFAQALGLLDYDKTSLAHLNYCDDDELSILAAGKASVVYCPRTHRYFGHPPHRWREMLLRGVNVAVGTDSCASSPDLNLVDDLRLLHAIAPDFPVDQLWQMATTRAARAIAMDGAVGSITPGKAADFVVFDVTTNDPLRELLDEQRSPRQVRIGGISVARAAGP
jgi:cytosine/adenosine deaminase-related metal-dependent hydrolase